MGSWRTICIRNRTHTHVRIHTHTHTHQIKKSKYGFWSILQLSVLLEFTSRTLCFTVCKASPLDLSTHMQCLSSGSVHTHAVPLFWICAHTCHTSPLDLRTHVQYPVYDFPLWRMLEIGILFEFTHTS